LSSIGISGIASSLGIPSDAVEPFGRGVGKVDLAFLSPNTRSQRGKLVLVTAMTPTAHGEGKTVTATGLAMALTKHGELAVPCLRQPSLGPVFGMKGGAAGGGKARVEPFNEINLGFTGDIYAVGSAHSLLSAIVDNHLFHGNALGIDPKSVTWPRTLDMDDRALRHITVGQGGPKDGVPREDGFVITAASEVMAILGMSRSYGDLKARLGNIVVGQRQDGSAVTARDMEAGGAMAVILRQALRPNLVATTEGTPAFVHGGPFANIAHGTASMVSILMGLQQADYCVVESGFASDLGAEKFVDIVARAGDFSVRVTVIVATIRALRHHGGASAAEDATPSVARVELGLDNLAKHMENARALGAAPVVALNAFPEDSPEEIQLVRKFVEAQGIPFAVSTAFRDGSAGAMELAERVLEAAAKGSQSRPLYSLDSPLEKKVESVVRLMYGGNGVAWSQEAMVGIGQAQLFGLAKAPVCIAKTHLSLSDDPKKLGRPKDFTVTARRVRSSVGAGFVVVLMGSIVTMPGLPSRPAAADMDLTDEGTIVGLH